MPVGTLLKFEIQLKDESPLIHGVGRVVWKREAGDTERKLRHQVQEAGKVGFFPVRSPGRIEYPSGTQFCPEREH